MKLLNKNPSISSKKKEYFPAGKIAEKAVWRSVFLTIWHCILNADSTKTHSSSVTFWRFCRLGYLLETENNMFFSLETNSTKLCFNS